MSGIVGIARPRNNVLVNRMLDKIAHRGGAGRVTMSVKGATLGIVWPEPQRFALADLQHRSLVHDAVGEGHLAQAQVVDGRLVLTRDPLGVAPLYYGWSNDGALCFASEVKALLPVTGQVSELPPGHRYDGQHLEAYFCLQKQPPLDEPPERLAEESRWRLAVSVEKCVGNQDVMGAWLSGGLDSSTMAALARLQVSRLHTFVAGLSGAPDLEYAREMAAFLDATHHEVIVEELGRMGPVGPDATYPGGQVNDDDV